MKENVTLSDLKAGDKVICIKKSSHPKFIKGDEYDIVMRTDSLYIVSHTYDLFAINKRTLETINEHFSLLTPQQPERLLSEADKEEKPFSVFLNEQNNYTLAYKEGTDNEALIAYSKDDEMLVDAAITLNNILNRHFKLISQTAQEEVKEEEDKDLAVELIARFHGTYGRNNQWGKRIKAAFVDGALWKEKKYHQKTSLLQQEVEKLREEKQKAIEYLKAFCLGVTENDETGMIETKLTGYDMEEMLPFILKHSK